MKPTLETASIVIPTYNRRELLERTLQSILAMRDVERCQIIVSDDGSSDGTREAVASYSNRLDIVYRFQEDLGFRAARARNAALDLAKHPLLIFLDCGMLVTSSFLHGHLAAHQHEPRAAAVIGYAYGFDRNNENGNRVQQLLDWEDIDASVRRLQKACLTPDPREELYGMVADDLARLPAPWALMWSCNCSIELDVFRMHRGFNENFVTWGGEDTELAYRLHRCGARFVLARDAAAIHAPHPKDGDALQPGSVANFARETSQYQDPMIRRLIELGDVEVNRFESPGRG